MKIDPTKSAVQNLLALIDASNPSAPDLPDEVTVSNLTAGSFANGADTQVTLTGTGPHGSANFDGSVDVTYKRLTLAAEATAPAGPVPLSAWISETQALQSILNYFGFIPSEVSAPSFTPLGTAGSQTVTLQASNSLVYEDGTTDVDVNWTKNTLSLLHFEGANNSTSFSDDTGRAWTPHGAAAIVTGTSKFGTGSYYNPGSAGDYISTPDAAELRLSGDYTVEFWVQPTTFAAAFVVTYKGSPSPNQGGRINLSGGSIYAYDDNLNSINGGSLTVDVWSHIALVKLGSTTTLYLNGVSVGSSTAMGSWGNNADPLCVGAASDGSYPMTAYVDEYRISDTARYSANFTPPAAPFTLD